MKTSIKDVCEFIWAIEEKYDLLNLKIDGVYVWESIRFKLYNEIVFKTRLMGEAHSSNKSIGSKISKLTNLALGSITKNPLNYSGNVKYIVFDHARKPKVNGEYCDIYTKYLLDEIGKESLVIENQNLGKHWTKSETNRKYSDYIKVVTVLGYCFFGKKKLDNAINIIINSIVNDIYNKFQIQVNLNKIIIRAVYKNKSEIKMYMKLFKKYKPEKVYIVVSYTKTAVVAAAKQLGIECIELQHGIITKYHIGYSYPNKYHRENIRYFPDKIMMFGDFWKGEYIPIDKEFLLTNGFGYFNDRYNVLKDVVREKKTILFISQGTIANSLSEIMYNVALKLNDYQFIYKLHPGEYVGWKEKYEYLFKASELDNVKIIDNSDNDLYLYMLKSEFLVGVYSTATYEGLALGCKLILLNLPGIENAEYIINNNYAKLVQDELELMNYIKDEKDQIEISDMVGRSIFNHK